MSNSITSTTNIVTCLCAVKERKKTNTEFDFSSEMRNRHRNHKLRHFQISQEKHMQNVNAPRRTQTIPNWQ